MEILIFLFGLVVGSFINSFVFRLHTKLTSDRSICFSCGEKIKAGDLIPLASYILSKGRCRTCKSKISLVYPLTELGLGVLFLLTYLIFGFSLETVLFFIVLSLFVAIFVYDLRHLIIPNAFVFPLIVISLILLFVEGNSISIEYFSLSPLLAGISFFIFFFVLWFISKGRWLGLGDGKLSFSIGVLLGVEGGITALILAFWIGSVVGLALIVFSKFLKRQKEISLKSEIPFAPFLIIGFLLVFFLNFTLFFGL